MSKSPKILAFAGSAREGSWNKKLVRAAAVIAEGAGAAVIVADLRDYPMPIFDEDLEKAEGIPERVLAFRELLKSHDGFLIASPEYNGAPSALLKNSIDWATRPRDGEVPLECFSGKTAALVAASPGGLGGLRGLPVLRYILSGIGVNVLGKDFALASAPQAFAADGSLVDDGKRAMLTAVVENHVRVTGLLAG